MSNGKYDLAKNWFLKYNEKEPSNQDAIRMAYACDRVKTLEPYFPNVKITAFEHNSEADDGAPVAINGGMAFTSDRSASGINPLKKKSGWTGRDYQRIYFSSLRVDGSYGNPDNFSKKLNELNMHCGPVSFTADKKFAVFSRTSATPDKNNTYNIQLYSTTSDDGKKWKKVDLIPFCKPEKNYMHPALSPDGMKLYFVSDKGGGLGGTDIYVSEKTGDKWGLPKNLGPVINTPSNEGFPFFHESGKLFFASKGHLSYGGFDILFSNLKEDDSWQKPVNIGQPINSSQDDISIFLDAAMESGYFVSSREGGDDDIYLFKALAGTNADLETIDFDEASNQGPEIEGIKIDIDRAPSKDIVSNTASSPKVSNEEEPKQITLDKVRTSGVDLEQPREKVTVNNNSTVTADTDSNTPLDNQNPKTKDKKVLSSNKYNSENEPHKIATAKENPSSHSTLPLNVNKTPEKQKVSSNQKIPVTQSSPSLEQNSFKTNDGVTASSVANNSLNSPKKVVNLMIPAKEADQKIDTNEMEYSSSDDTAEYKEQDLSITKEPVIGTQNTIEASYATQEETESSLEEFSSSSEEVLNKNTQVLDRETADTPPPVLMGEDASILSESKPKTLTELAELLQVGQAIPNKGFQIQGIDYATGSFLLSPESTRALAAVTDLLNMHPDLNIEIGSHTSAPGKDIENHNLSTKRARSIKAYLVYKGISGDRILAKGYGETNLLNNCSNGVDCTPVQHSENDRIEIKIK
jgi:outer membrane protein OmpA-like peptidoglycan-associated protein